MNIVDPKERISLKYMLEHRNINGEIYDVDVSRWLGFWLNTEQTDDIKKQLLEVISYEKNNKEIRI